MANVSDLFERAIEFVSPRTAYRRAQQRAALSLTRGYLQRHEGRYRGSKFSYEGAQPGRRAYGWFASSADANVELMGSLVWLRNRSRDLTRNNPYASKAIEELVGNSIGTGIVPQAQSGDPALNRIIDEEWKYFAEQCDIPQRMDFYAMEALVVRTMAESGESIARFRPRLPQQKLRVPLQLQILESDFLDHARTMGTVNGHIMQGVEFNLMGERVAYWLYTYHPGGVLILNPRGGILSMPFPANQVLHSFRTLRPGQVRGVPWLAPVMMALRDLDDYADAERTRKKIEACVVAFVTQPEGSAGSPLGLNKGTDHYNNQPVETFEPGMVEYLKVGQDIKFNNPQPSGGYREYKMVELQGIMAGIGLPYELGTGDMSQVNYSSWRGGMIGFRATIEAYRWLTVVPEFCMPVRRRFIDTLVLQGKIPSKYLDNPKVSLYGTQWTAPRFESVDPMKDIQARVKEIRAGLMTLSEGIVANGYDPYRQLQEIARTNKMLDDLGIILDIDPRNVTDKGQEQPVASSEQKPDKPGATPPLSKANTKKAAQQQAERLATLEAKIEEYKSAATAEFRRDLSTRSYVN